MKNIINIIIKVSTYQTMFVKQEQKIHINYNKKYISHFLAISPPSYKSYIKMLSA